MSNTLEKKESTKYANIDMDKFKFDFNLFVPSSENSSSTKEEEKEA